jgi:hypothetical protein
MTIDVWNVSRHIKLDFSEEVSQNDFNRQKHRTLVEETLEMRTNV